MANKLHDIIERRILILDGAMGTMIQRYGLREEDFRGERFASHNVRLEGNNDLLVLSRPEIIAAIHRDYLEAGADILETCTFNAQRISQEEYHTTEHIREINLAAARIARTEADRMTLLTPEKPRFVAGSIGPTGKSASLSPDVENPAQRAVTFDTLREAYAEQIDALIDGGVDILLIETVFDTLNAKAALVAAEETFARHGIRLPIMLSVTIADLSGRILSGQTLEALLASVQHFDLFSIGLNCSFGAKQMVPYLKELATIAPCYISAYPNAGIPDAMGHYDQTPRMMAEAIAEIAGDGLVNIVGGCCGSTPDHIRAIAERVADIEPMKRSPQKPTAWLAGLEGFNAGKAFINVGERCNVAGSRKFLRLIKEKSYDEALTIARRQVADGAMILDINMDDAMIDSREEMCRFLNLMASDPDIARLPWMIDSSRFEVIEAALKCIQGKAIVNSLSLKEGEDLFLERARHIRKMGAALVVMAFDEEGQATTFERKTAICQRAYKLLTEQVGFPAHDIIFDPNILTIATGIAEHAAYALDFIRATEWIHHNLPAARVSGGVSNLSFALRGNNFLREAMHAVFLYHAIKAGMDMAIVNPSTAVMYEDIPAELLSALEDVILNRREDATERLLAIAGDYTAAINNPTEDAATSRHSIALEERLAMALQRGEEEHLQEDLEEALRCYPTPAAIIEGPLMHGMGIVGELFGQGKMFLPQVVKSARTMKRAVDILQPYIEASRDGSAHSMGRYLIATVKGDVHDIGKNIAGVVLACNNFEVIDLGVMVSAEAIVEAAKSYKADFIGLSGLITPSLDEMCNVARELKAAGISVPLFIGGATTSALHTAVKIAPLYDGAAFHVVDASQNPVIATRLTGDEREATIAQLKQEQEALRASLQSEETAPTATHRLKIDWQQESLPQPAFEGIMTIEIPIDQVRPYINMRHFYNLWRVKPETPEAENLSREAEAMLDSMAQRFRLRGRVGIFQAYGTSTSRVVKHAQGCTCCHDAAQQSIISTPRQMHDNKEGVALALCDFVATESFGDHIGAFAVTVDEAFAAELEQLKATEKQYEALMMQSLGDRLAEAASEWLHEKVRRELWGYAPEERLSPKELFQASYQGIRPAVGYPSLPDQREIFKLDALLDLEQIGIRLTENGAMYPQASVCGLYLASPHARYFMVK